LTPLTGGDPVLQGALVEDVGGEGAEGRVHAVLHLQADGPDAQDHQALKQRLGEARLRRLLAHDHGAQLAVVPHQDQLGGAGDIQQTFIENSFLKIDFAKPQIDNKFY